MADLKPILEKKDKPITTMSAMDKLNVYNELISRAALAARLGDQYGGDRNVYQALGYPSDISFEDYAAKYSRQDIARAVINRPVNHTWKGEIKLTEVGVKEETELEKKWKELNMELRLKSKFIRVDKLSSIGHYGILLLGFDDVKQVGDFEKPVASGKRKLLYVKPLGEGSAKIATYVKDTKDPRYGLVEKYNVEFTPRDVRRRRN